MLTQKDVPSNLSLFVETKFVNHTYVTDGWWAIDDVRVCHNNEVKFGHLKLTPIGNRNGKIDNDLYCKFMGTETSRLTKIDVDEAKSKQNIIIAN
ncbi:hypothetical protein GWI33_000512 [Rhynchophorus ferrugineus]|uniref:Uncharacterized protein n=1 Tax=Rhynchophorus ferrugineus TaxID=354439 RepID=A0A834M269_RHYFE|nr:hypothetical protein GWI33_000512 [Rhynchophorus ferrugineus]